MFFWQSKTRIISEDVQFSDNQKILDYALNNRGKFVMFDDYGGKIKTNNDKIHLDLIRKFYSHRCVSGYKINYELYKITYLKQ